MTTPLWTYSDFDEQADDESRLARLRQHLTEVRNQMRVDSSGDGRSRNHASLEAYLRSLDERRRELERVTGDRAPTKSAAYFGGF